MADKEKKSEWFSQNGLVMIALDDEGYIVTRSLLADQTLLDPVEEAVSNIQDPSIVAEYFHARVDGITGSNVSTLEFLGNSVIARLSLPDESYTKELTRDQFAALLHDWEQAWGDE